MSLPGRILIIVLRGYQLVVSPCLGPCCRFHPTCSRYAIEAVRRHGALKGSYLTMVRLLRCHPWAAWGEDPVPEQFTFRNGHIKNPHFNRGV